jgi:hypothetical protein
MSLDAPRRERLIDDFARRIVSAGMTAPAILFLEMHKPLAFLGAQMLWIAQPFLALGFRDADIRDLALLIEDRANVQALINRLESLEKTNTTSSDLP